MPGLVGLLAGGAVAAITLAAGTRREATVVALFDRSTARSLAVLRGRLAAASLVRRLARVDRLARAIAASGRAANLDDVIAVKFASAGGVAIGIVLLMGPAALPVALLAAAGAFVMPDVALGRAAKRRRVAADGEVAQFLDLLAAASSAGLSAPAAIGRACTGVRGPLRRELEDAAAAVELGGRWRDELAAIAERLQLPDLRAAVVVIARTETLGSSLSESLQLLVADVRGSRRARAAERARTAPVKMLFPLVFMVLPAFLLLTVVPVLIATIRSL